MVLVDGYEKTFNSVKEAKAYLHSRGINVNGVKFTNDKGEELGKK